MIDYELGRFKIIYKQDNGLKAWTYHNNENTLYDFLKTIKNVVSVYDFYFNRKII